MKVVLVGPPAMRARLRTQMNGSTTIVGEFASLGSAQAARLAADAFVMAAGNTDDQDDSRNAHIPRDSGVGAPGRRAIEQGDRPAARHQRPDREISRRGDLGKARRRESHRRGPSSDSPRHRVGLKPYFMRVATKL